MGPYYDDRSCCMPMVTTARTAWSPFGTGPLGACYTAFAKEAMGMGFFKRTGKGVAADGARGNWRT